MASRRAPTPDAPRKPTPEQIEQAHGRTIPDVIGPGLRVLFCGINPSLYSAAVGHHFARPGNRFWPALHASGVTDRRLSPFEDRSLLDRGFGLTNLVARATASADELEPDELVKGGRALRRKIRRHQPRALAVLGIGAFRHAFARPEARAGEQPERLEEARVFVLPNPSGLNAHYRLEDIAEALRALCEALRGDS